MTQLSSKICILGDFAVGKTSTVERFVNNQFSDKYLTTIGVKIDTREIELENDVSLKLVIWDIAGTDRFGPIEMSYLRGASGYIIVADGTRADTTEAALALKAQAVEQYGELPYVFLLNKSDLEQSWDVTERQLEELSQTLKHVYVTSAKSGDKVDQAILKLATMIAERGIL